MDLEKKKKLIQHQSHCSEYLPSAALQHLSLADETFAGASSDPEENLWRSQQVHCQRDWGAQDKLRPYGPERLHWLLPQWDWEGGSLILLWQCCETQSIFQWFSAVHHVIQAAITYVGVHVLPCLWPSISLTFFLVPLENLNNLQTKGQPDNSFYEENLIWCVLDLFVAGSETTSTTLRWALLYMSKYPEIQGRRERESKVIRWK